MSRPGLFGRRLVAAAVVVVLIWPGFLVESMLGAASPQSETPSSASEKSPTRIRYERIRVLANRLEAGQDVEAELAALVAEVQEAVDAAPSADAASDEAELDPQRRGEALSVYFGASALADSLRRSGERPRERFEHRARAFHAATVVASWSSAGRAAVELANAAIDAGDVALARPWLIRALDVLPADAPRRTDIASALAQVENFIGNWDEALRRLEEAEAALPLTHPQVELLRARLAGFRGEVFLSMGLIDQCATWCEREWRVMRDVSDERAALRERARIHRMNLFLAAERFEEVVADLEPLLEGGSLDSLPSERAALRVRLGVALASLERADPDRDLRAVEVLQSVASDSDPAVATERTNAELRLVQTHLERDEFDEAERWLARIRERPAPSRLDQAFRDALETLLILKRRPDSDPDDRTRLERQSAALRTGFDSLVQAYDAVLDEWYELRLRQGGAGLLHYETVRFVLSVLIDTTLELDPTDEERALEPVLAGLRASTLARRLGVEPDHHRGEFPIASDDDPPIVLFLPAIEVTHVFWIDGEGVAHARAPSRPELERMRLPFVDTLTRGATTRSSARAGGPAVRRALRTVDARATRAPRARHDRGVGPARLPPVRGTRARWRVAGLDDRARVHTVPRRRDDARQPGRCS